jgi:hypothetical protein
MARKRYDYDDGSWRVVEDGQGPSPRFAALVVIAIVVLILGLGGLLLWAAL